MKVIKESFGQIDNQSIFSYTLVNDQGLELTAINYGCIITRINLIKGSQEDGMICTGLFYRSEWNSIVS